MFQDEAGFGRINKPKYERGVVFSRNIGVDIDFLNRSFYFHPQRQI